MKRIFSSLLAAAAGAVLVASVGTPSAQTGAQKVGFVDVPTAYAAHPQAASVSAKVKEIESKASGELGGLRSQITAISNKGTAATAAERQQLAQLEKTFEARFQDYVSQIEAQSKTVNTGIDQAIAKVAKANGYSIVMDRQKAGEGLVVFAEGSADLTAAVVAELKKNN